MGQPSPPGPIPPDFLSLRRQIQSTAVGPASSPTLVSVIREQMETLARRLADIENTLNGLMRRPETPISASQVAGLNEFVLQSFEKDVRQVEERLAQRFRPQAAAPSPELERTTTMVEGLRKEFAGIKTQVLDLAERIEKVEAERRVRRFKAASPASNAAERPLPAQALAALEERPPAALPLASPPTPATSPAPVLEPRPAATDTTAAKQPAARSQGLPVAWQEVVGGVGVFRGLGEKELSESLQKIKLALEELPGGSEIRLVHLMETIGRFRVHDAVTSPQGQVLCRTCDGPRTFQVGICAGEEGATQLQVILPPGDYAPYNYPAGYRQLIQNMPNEQFRIQTVIAPALLMLVPGTSPAEYTVQYRLQWR
jgi:hypothetical protein